MIDKVVRFRLKDLKKIKSKWNQYRFWLFTLFFFSMTLNRGFFAPIDKIILFASIPAFAFLYKDQIKLSSKEWLSMMVVFIITCTAILFNVSLFDPVIITPMVGLFFALMFPYFQTNIKTVYYGLGAYVALSMLLVVLSYKFNLLYYVRPLYDKGLPNFNAPMAFSPTVQVVCTFCNICIFIYLKEYSKNISSISTIDKGIFYICVFCIIISFSRSSQIALLLLLAYHYKRLFIVFFVGGLLALLFINFDDLNGAILATNTIESRMKFMDGFIYAFFYIGTWTGQVFGFGSFKMTDFIISQTNSLNLYIENGTLGLLHCFGFIGMFFYYFLIIRFIAALNWKDYLTSLMAILYLLLIPQSTHEFLSVSFYVFLAVLFYYNHENKSLIESTPKGEL